MIVHTISLIITSEGMQGQRKACFFAETVKTIKGQKDEGMGPVFFMQAN